MHGIITALASPLCKSFDRSTERFVCYKVLRPVQHQRIGNAVILGVLHHSSLEKVQVEDVDLRIVLHRNWEKVLP